MQKFDIYCMMTNQSDPFAKYPVLVELEKSRHGVNLDPAYRTPDSAKLFTCYIAECHHQLFLSKFLAV